MAEFAPLLVDGSRGSAEQVRRIVWLAAAGDYGRSSGLDLLVTATSPATSSVTVGVGSGVMDNPSNGAPFVDALAGQSYLVTAPAPFAVAVPANTGASAVTRRLWMVGADPQYPSSGSVVDPSYADDYVSLVWTEGAGSLPSAVAPRLRLCDIVIPASTATITQAMITVNPKLVRPRTKGDVVTGNGPATPSRMVVGAVITSPWPTTTASLAVPAWAKRLKVIGHISGMVYDGRGSTLRTDYPSGTTDSMAFTRIKFGTLTGPTVNFRANVVAIVTVNTMAAATFDVTALRGTTQTLSFDSGPVYSATPGNPWWCDSSTAVALDYMFSED